MHIQWNIWVRNKRLKSILNVALKRVHNHALFTLTAHTWHYDSMFSHIIRALNFSRTRRRIHYQVAGVDASMPETLVIEANARQLTELWVLVKLCSRRWTNQWSKGRKIIHRRRWRCVPITHRRCPLAPHNCYRPLLLPRLSRRPTHLPRLQPHPVSLSCGVGDFSFFFFFFLPFNSPIVHGAIK
jgi:hypothetical protein